MKKVNTKQRLFEIMSTIDSSFKKKVNEDVQLQRYDDSVPATYLSDFEERVYSYIEKMYPNIQQISIAEKFIPNKGWIDCKCFVDEKTIDKLAQEGVTQVNLTITDGNNNTFYPDYSMKEFMDLKNN